MVRTVVGGACRMGCCPLYEFRSLILAPPPLFHQPLYLSRDTHLQSVWYPVDQKTAAAAAALNLSLVFFSFDSPPFLPRPTVVRQEKMNDDATEQKKTMLRATTTLLVHHHTTAAAPAVRIDNNLLLFIPPCPAPLF